MTSYELRNGAARLGIRIVNNDVQVHITPSREYLLANAVVAGVGIRGHNMTESELRESDTQSFTGVVRAQPSSQTATTIPAALCIKMMGRGWPIMQITRVGPTYVLLWVCSTLIRGELRHIPLHAQIDPVVDQEDPIVYERVYRNAPFHRV